MPAGRSPRSLPDWALPAIVAIVAAVPLLYGLGQPYLWQDEAATAVLAQRLVHDGKPLGYDGRNLITMDYATPQDAEAMPVLTGEPQAAVAYFVKRGDFREDTTWIGQPWGQFLAAGASLAALGPRTAAARLPFALASVLTVVLLFQLVRSVLRDAWVAGLAAALLAVNPYWVLHGRQCRYYALSGLFELLTVAAFVRWQRGGRFGGALLATSAWCWFHCDFGAVWPGIGALLLIGALSRPGWPASVRAGIAIAASTLPFAVYYRLLGRLKVPWEGWGERFFGLVFNVNQFVVPLAVLIAVAALLLAKRRALESGARDLLIASTAIVAAAAPWSAAVGPSHYHRYVVHVTPFACLLIAWGAREGAAWLAQATGRRGLRFVASAAMAGCVAVSPLASKLMSWSIPHETAELPPMGTWIRAELALASGSIFGERPDPNREAIELVAARARAGDEVLVAYEDVPFMFYTDLRVRGGIAAFRIDDPGAPPPRFLVARPGVPMGQWPAFLEASDRYGWEVLPTRAPAVWWGNNPDPVAQSFWLLGDLPKIVVAERSGDAPRAD